MSMESNSIFAPQYYAPPNMQTISAPQLMAAIHADQIIGGISLILVILAFATRVYVRARMTKQWAVQDWVMMAAFVCMTSTINDSILTFSDLRIRTHWSISSEWLHLIKSGEWRRHRPPSLPRRESISSHPPSPSKPPQLYRLAGITFVFCIITLKISIGMFILSIFSASRLHRYSVYAIMLLTLLFGIIYLPFGVFTCAQFRTYADEVLSCPQHIQIATSVLYALFTIITFIGGFAYCLMGAMALWRANLPRSTTILASLLIALFSIAGITAIVRLALLLMPADISRLSQEELWMVRVMLIEIAVSMIAANMAMTRPLFQRGNKGAGRFSMVRKGQRMSGESERKLVDPKIMIITPADEIYELEA